MLGVDRFVNQPIDSPESALLEIYHSKISLHHAKTGYNYPDDPPAAYVFKACRIADAYISNSYTMGRFAFLVVVFLLLARAKKGPRRDRRDSPLPLDIRIYTAKVGRSNRPEPIDFLIRRLARSALKLIFLATVLRISHPRRCGCESTTPIVSGAWR